MPFQANHIGPYELLGNLGSGGMATVFLARYCGPLGFSRPVAVKRLHESLARDPAFVSMLLDEARLGAQVRHPLVAEVIDLVAEDPEVCLVMQYVHGASLRGLLELDSSPVQVSIAAAVICDALHGLHAAHEARSRDGALLGIVHRDVSPHNLLVGSDGFTRVTDFGIAKAIWRAQSTCDGQLKGKLAYMAPEQLARGKVDRRADIFGAAVVLWELLAGKRLFEGTDPDQLLDRSRSWTPPQTGRDEVAADLEQIVLRGLSPDPARRFETALQMASALENACRPASRSDVAAWVERVAGGDLARRAAQVGRDVPMSAAGSSGRLASGAWKVPPDSATLPNEPQGGDRTPTGLGTAASDTVRSSAGSRRTALAAALAAALGVIATVFLTQVRSGDQSGSRASAQGAGSTAVVEARMPAELEAPKATAVVSTSPVPAVSSAPPAVSPAPARPGRPSKAPVVARPACDPPYRTDDAGVKVYKMECL